MRKGRGTRDQIANIHWVIKKAREFQKNMYFCFIDYAKTKPLTVWITINCGKFFEMRIPPPELPPEKSVCRSRRNSTQHGTTDWFQIWKGAHQGCILSPCLFNLYAEYILRNAGLDEAQAGIKIAGRNINSLRYADDTTLMAESKELKSHLMKVKEESKKVGLKLNIQKIKIIASGPITSWQIDRETVETVADFIFWGALKSLQMVTTAMKLKYTLHLGRKVMTNLDSILKIRHIALPKKVCLFKAMVFPVVMYG